MAPADDPHERRISARICWQAMLLREAAHDAQVRAGAVVKRLSAFDPDELYACGSVAIDTDALREIAGDVLALHDVVDRLRFPAEAVRPTAGGILAADVEDIAREATLALAEGSIDIGYVLLAARAVNARGGLTALAAALAGDPTLCGSWEETTVGEVLSCFRGAEDSLVGEPCRAAGVDPAQRWDELDVSAVTRLAEALWSGVDA
jgi:hypothetical protein